jgi:hypothetical protein
MKFKISANPVAIIFDMAGEAPDAKNNLVIQRSKNGNYPNYQNIK